MSIWRSKLAGALRSADRGQAIAELALVAPLVLILLIGAAEVARYANFSILVSNAARAGVQYGAQNLVTAADNAGMQSAAQADAQDPSMTATASSFCTCANGNASTCQATDCPNSHRLVYVKVDTSETYQSMLHYPGITPSLQIKGHAVMRVVQ
jgi:Flp pilus assembly protein TadG